MKHKIITISTIVVAIGLSTCAAYYSIFGLSKLFAGAGVAVIIMASFLEVSKLLVTTILHSGIADKWNKSSKIILNFFMIGLMFITSIGVYGFLTNAYQTTANKLSVMDSEIKMVDNRKKIFSTNIARINDQIESKTKRADQLSDIRKQQEVRLDSLYAKGWTTSAKNTEKIIKEANTDVDRIRSEIDVLVSKINDNNDSISNLDIKTFGMTANSDVAAEIGPLKYTSELTGVSMDRMINYYILIFIILFDPLAITLVIAFNKMTNKVDNIDKNIEDITVEEPESDIQEQPIVVNQYPEERPSKENKQNDIPILVDDIVEPIITKNVMVAPPVGDGDGLTVNL